MHQEMVAATHPALRLYRVIPDARLPQRADRSAGGTLPTRASGYCDAVTAAAAFGWHLRTNGVQPALGRE